MKKTNLVFFFICISLLNGCDDFKNNPEKQILKSTPEKQILKSTLEKQIEVCENDVKLGLGDPNSLETISTRNWLYTDGTKIVELNFTAKNSMGGRVRGQTTCGFNDINSIELKSGHPSNVMREASRVFGL